MEARSGICCQASIEIPTVLDCFSFNPAFAVEIWVAILSTTDITLLKTFGEYFDAAHRGSRETKTNETPRCRTGWLMRNMWCHLLLILLPILRRSMMFDVSEQVDAHQSTKAYILTGFVHGYKLMQVDKGTKLLLAFLLLFFDFLRNSFAAFASLNHLSRRTKSSVALCKAASAVERRCCASAIEDPHYLPHHAAASHAIQAFIRCSLSNHRRRRRRHHQ